MLCQSTCSKDIQIASTYYKVTTNTNGSTYIDYTKHTRSSRSLIDYSSRSVSWQFTHTGLLSVKHNSNNSNLINLKQAFTRWDPLMNSTATTNTKDLPSIVGFLNGLTSSSSDKKTYNKDSVYRKTSSLWLKNRNYLPLHSTWAAVLSLDRFFSPLMWLQVLCCAVLLWHHYSCRLPACCAKGLVKGLLSTSFSSASSPSTSTSV